MERATGFMFDEVANRGGFVWVYTGSLEPYGELKARDSMIWVEPPSTPTVGLMLLEAFRVTGDEIYLDRAGRVADALIAGQHPSGGWNYFIDFDPDGLPAYWDAFFSKCWGWQEYLKRRTNCTFDDYATTEPTRFFLRLCEVCPEPRYREARDKALGHILRAQYPNGAWPQRYPPEPGVDDYTRYYTFNDEVIADCIDVLLEAHALLGEDRYHEAARKAMDFYLLSRLPEPRPGWAQQYTLHLKPGWGRPFEIGTVCSAQTLTNVRDLIRFYGITGDRKYLAPIPAALDWLDRVRLKDAEPYTHTYYYEMDTGRPVYMKQTGTTAEDVTYTITHDPEGAYPYGVRLTLPVDEVRAQYERWAAMTPEQAKAEYRRREEARGLPRCPRGYYLHRALGETAATADGVREILEAMDERGGWPEQVSLLHPFQPFTGPRNEFTGYTTGGYVARMYRLIGYLSECNETGKDD